MIYSFDVFGCFQASKNMRFYERRELYIVKSSIYVKAFHVLAIEGYEATKMNLHHSSAIQVESDGNSQQ